MSTITATEAAAAAKAIAVQFRSVLQVGEALEHLGSVENATAEARRLHALGQQALARQAEEINRLAGDITQAQALYGEVKQLILVARQEAAEQAANIVAAGEAEAQTLVAAAQAAADGLAVARAAVQVEIETALRHLLDKQTELQEIEARIEKVRLAAAAIAGV